MGPLDSKTMSLKKAINAIYDACFSVVTRTIPQEFLCVEIHAQITKTVEGGIILIVKVSPSSVRS